MRIEVASKVIEALRVAAEQEHPHEACGILLGVGNRVSTFLRTRNVHPQPETHFEIDPIALINAHREARSGGLQILGYFHSHPKGKPCPSETDKEMAAGDGRIWAIFGEGKIAFFQDKTDGFKLLSCTIADG